MRGLYSGLTASYLGVTEGVIQWVLYERMKRLTGGDGKSRTVGGEKMGVFQQWLGMMGSAGTAKIVASLVTYPHEVSAQRITIQGILHSTSLFARILTLSSSLIPGAPGYSYSSAAASVPRDRNGKIHRTPADP